MKNILDKIDKKIEEGIMSKRAAGMKSDLDKKYGKSGGKLVDKIYNQLIKIKEFKNLSMDRQGEVSIAVEKMIK
jgi:hypothetical protein